MDTRSQITAELPILTCKCACASNEPFEDMRELCIRCSNTIFNAYVSRYTDQAEHSEPKSHHTNDQDMATSRVLQICLRIK